ncbi:MAG: hypothetical protein M3384_05605 [Acidobacteriota bacterium]|nr:hypothetical protein [Acidobacteriota bacterium]
MNDDGKKNDGDEEELFSTTNRFSETESHILRNILIGMAITFLLGLGLLMIISTVFADACA